MSHFEAIVRAHQGQGRIPRFLQAPGVASLAVNGNEVVLVRTIPGIHMTAELLADGVRLRLIVEPGLQVEKPVHLCIGSTAERGIQRIVATFEIGSGAHIEFLACCSFPNAVQFQHIMEGTTYLGPDATIVYRETHHHNGIGGVALATRARVKVDERARFFSGFSVTEGRAGSLNLSYEVDVAALGLAELNARGLGYGDDRIVIRELIRLNGQEARGLAKSRIAVRDRARSEVYSTLEGNAPFAWGHVDCVEIVRDEATANAVPLLLVNDDRAQLTHEAAIGTVDKKELETLMARAVDEETAVDIIVRGLLGEGIEFAGRRDGSGDAWEESVDVPAIEVQDLTRDYGNLRAVDHASFTVEPGEVFGFLGPNGAGKTTTVRMLTTLLEPTYGTALLNGCDIVHQSYQARRQFGVVPEESNVYRELTARANLLFSGKLYRVPKAERERRAVELMTRFGLADRLGSIVDTFSRGMRRKLTIAMALMHRPSILFLDESTAGLDVQGQRSIVEFIRQLNAEGMTIFLTTHQIEEASQLCHRVAIINQGKIVAIDTPERLKQAFQSVQSVEVALDPYPREAQEHLADLPDVTGVVRHGDKWRLYTPSPSRLLPAVTAYAEQHRLRLVSLNTLGPSLEDVFLQITGQPLSARREEAPERRRRRCEGRRH